MIFVINNRICLGATVDITKAHALMAGPNRPEMVPSCAVYFSYQGIRTHFHTGFRMLNETLAFIEAEKQTGRPFFVRFCPIPNCSHIAHDPMLKKEEPVADAKQPVKGRNLRAPKKRARQ